MFFTYIIQSQCDDSFYIGHSSDIKQRLEYHNGGLSKYTSKKMPWKLVYLEVYQTKADANRRELFLKKQRSRSFYKQLILSDTNLMENLMRKYRPVTPRVAGFPSTRDPHRLKKLQEIEAFFVCVPFLLNHLVSPNNLPPIALLLYRNQQEHHIRKIIKGSRAKDGE